MEKTITIIIITSINTRSWIAIQCVGFCGICWWKVFSCFRRHMTYFQEIEIFSFFNLLFIESSMYCSAFTSDIHPPCCFISVRLAPVSARTKVEDFLNYSPVYNSGPKIQKCCDLFSKHFDIFLLYFPFFSFCYFGSSEVIGALDCILTSEG